MAEDVITGYAKALLSVAEVEGDSRVFEAEFAQVAKAVRASEELRTVISDSNLPAAQRQQIVEEVLSGKSSRVTTALVSMIVGAGRGADLGPIADRVAQLGAGQRGRVVADVRSAIALTADQEQRLVEALKTATGKDVELRVVVDPSVLGGLITQIGDEIVDGSVRTRLGQLRESF